MQASKSKKRIKALETELFSTILKKIALICFDVMILEDAERIVSLIVEKTGKEITEVQELVERKKEKFSGLLTDSGAAFLVAKELNADLELENGIRNIDLEARVLQAFQARSFEKNEKKGIMQNLILGDESGSIRLTLWNQQVKEFERQKIEKGSLLVLNNCFVTEYNGRKQLNIGFNGITVFK